jgi:glycerol kinase
VSEKNLLGAAISIAGMAGDQQAATIGQACFSEGMIKSTYGTGCFMLLNTGNKAVVSSNQLLSTIAYRLQGKVTYGLEGSIFSAGVVVKWLRDNMHFIKTAAETEDCARRVTDTDGVYLVPGFTGLGAPYWDPEARGAIMGLTRKSSIEHIVRAGLESVCYQTNDLLQAMKNDNRADFAVLRVDGGMVANNWLLQFLADILQIEVQRPVCSETSALGAAFLAGLQVGLYESLDEISKLWQANASYVPSMPNSQREKLYAGWKNAVRRVLTT